MAGDDLGPRAVDSRSKARPLPGLFSWGRPAARARPAGTPAPLGHLASDQFGHPLPVVVGRSGPGERHTTHNARRARRGPASCIRSPGTRGTALPPRVRRAPVDQTVVGCLGEGDQVARQMDIPEGEWQRRQRSFSKKICWPHLSHVNMRTVRPSSRGPRHRGPWPPCSRAVADRTASPVGQRPASSSPCRSAASSTRRTAGLGAESLSLPPRSCARLAALTKTPTPEASMKLTPPMSTVTTGGPSVQGPGRGPRPAGDRWRRRRRRSPPRRVPVPAPDRYPRHD